MELLLTLNSDPSKPLYRRLSDALRQAILEERLKPGQSLPSVTRLAAQLGIARATVLRSYKDLNAKGYLISTSGSGTYVSQVLPAKQWAQSSMATPLKGLESRCTVFSAYAQRLLRNEHVHSQPHSDTTYDGPPADMLPLRQWSNSLISICQSENPALLEYSADPFGHLPLREALAAYLARSRGIKCNPEQIAVFGGAQFRFDVLARVLLEPGSYVAVENPGFPAFRQAVASYGACIEPVPVDREGIRIDALQAISHKVKLLCVTPSHQVPSGTVMSMSRRAQLLKWAAPAGCYILEDDVDNEYWYSGEPLPALMSLDASRSVVYLSSFWKVLFPLLRLGFLVLPEELISVVCLAKSKVERDVPLIDQLALTDFINEGHLERCIHRARSAYAIRRKALLSCLLHHMGSVVEIIGHGSGMSLLTRFHVGRSDDELVSLARQSGLCMVSTHPYYVGIHPPGEFMVTFAHHNVQVIEESVECFARMIEHGS